jgi:hypothetical protein
MEYNYLNIHIVFVVTWMGLFYMPRFLLSYGKPTKIRSAGKNSFNHSSIYDNGCGMGITGACCDHPGIYRLLFNGDKGRFVVNDY